MAAKALEDDWNRREPLVLIGFAATGHPAWRGRLETTAHAARAIAGQWSDARIAACRAHGAHTTTPEVACLDQLPVGRGTVVTIVDKDVAPFNMENACLHHEKITIALVPPPATG